MFSLARSYLDDNFFKALDYIGKKRKELFIQKNEEGDIPLHIAAGRNHFRVIQTMMKYLPPDALNIQDGKGKTVFQKTSNAEKLKKLLQTQ